MRDLRAVFVAMRTRAVAGSIFCAAAPATPRTPNAPIAPYRRMRPNLVDYLVAEPTTRCIAIVAPLSPTFVDAAQRVASLRNGNLAPRRRRRSSDWSHTPIAQA